MNSFRALFNEKADFVEGEDELKVDFLSMSASLTKEGVVVQGIKLPVEFAVFMSLMLESILEPYLPRVASQVGITREEGDDWLVLMDQDSEVLAAAPLTKELKAMLSAKLVSPTPTGTLQ